MAAMGTAGTSGTRNPGALRLSPRRNATTEACTNANKPRNARLARIAIVSIVRKTRKPAPTNVRATAAGGTSRPPMRAKLPGRRRSRAMLNEVLIAAVRFEFKAPYIETIPMINTTTLTYGPPTKCRMPERTMSSDPPRQPPHAGHPDSLSLGTFPSTAKKNPPYTRNASKSARNTPRGTLLSGCFTWSDSCATTSKPWKAMKRTPAPSIKSSDETEAPTAKPRGGPGWKTEMTPRTATRTISRILPNVNRPSARTGRWTRAKCAIAERARTARATRLTSTGFGPKNDDGSDGRTSSTRKIPRPRALSADAAMWPPQESQPLRNPLGAGNALLTQTYAPPEASGRPDASSAYAMPARAATSAATARLSKTRGPATAYAAPTRRKIAAPTIAPRAAIVMSNRPRSRVTRTRTEADPEPGPDTEGRRMGRLLEAMAVGRYRADARLQSGRRAAGYADADFAAVFAIVSPSVRKTSSTFSPVFAELKKYGASNASVACFTCSSPNAAWSFRSVLLIANATGISPTVPNTDSTHESRSSSVSYRVMSATARMPCAPWKSASRSSSRNPFEPMMSQMVMSIWIASPPFGLRASSFFETFAPSDTMYRSSYSFST